MKQINVCHKHSDLLKQARERLTTNKDDFVAVSRPHPVVTSKLTASGGKSELGTHTSGGGRLVEPSTPLTPAGAVTSIVYTDEGGRQQKMVGKIVVACSDAKGQSNIIIQEVDEADQEEEEAEREKMVNLNFSDIDGYMTLSRGTGKQVTDSVEELEHRLEQEMEGKEARMEEELDAEASRQAMGTVIPIQGETQAVTKMSEATGANTVYDSVTIPLGDNQIMYQPLSASKASETKTITFYEEPRKPFIYQNKTRISVPASRPVTEKPVTSEGVTGADQQLLRIQCRGYTGQGLASELTSLASRPEMADTVLVCGDGRFVTSSLLLAPAIPWLVPVLDSVVRIDEYKTVIMPEEVSIRQLTLLQSLVSSVNPPDLNSEGLVMLKNVCLTLKCDELLSILGDLGNSVQYLKQESEKAAGKKRKSSSSPRKKTKFIRTEPNVTDNQSQVKLEKTELNADYLHSDGSVRLSSSDEMAMHYCLLCEAKFKKYNQAVTHYDQSHSLRAALACDMCEMTFRDMYNCVKHKHEVHGQFDVNFQCYLCKEVLYSRFRLGTHIKESHKSHYGEFVCKACGMKFAAKYYLQIHQQERHSDTANTCGICQKTFSGKRYLTMHIKASHESPSDEKT